jgi:uncharacterized membrane protein YjjP (DUF1212 family)
MKPDTLVLFVACVAAESFAVLWPGTVLLAALVALAGLVLAVLGPRLVGR